jgi:hypothetical protein
MVMISAAASAISMAVTALAAVVAFVATVAVMLAATSTAAAGLYVTARLVAAVAMTRTGTSEVETVPEIGPGAVAALPTGDTTPLAIPAVVMEVDR